MLSATIVVFLASLVLPGMRIKKETTVLSKDETVSLKGLLCLFVYFNHFSGWFLNFDPVLYFLVHCGSFMVSVFFFLSAYGLSKSPGNQKETVKDLFRRVLRLLVPFWISDFLYIMLNYSMNVNLNVPINAHSVILSVFNLSEIVHNSWFVSAIIVLYIIYFVVKKTKHIDQVVLFAIMLICISFLVPEIWLTFFAFPLGLLISKKEERFIRIKLYKYVLLLLLSVIGIAVFVALKYLGDSNEKYVFLKDISDPISGCFFSFLVYLILTRIHIGNKALRFIGKVSYEFYLVHGLGIFFANKFFDITQPIAFMVLSLLFSFVFAVLVNKLSGLISGLFQKNKD